MKDKRILMLASMVDMSTNVQEDKATVTAKLRKTGLSADAIWRAGKESELDAGARALTNLLAKLDAVQEITAKLGPRPEVSEARREAGRRVSALRHGYVEDKPQEVPSALPGSEVPGAVVVAIEAPGRGPDNIDDPANGIDVEIDL